MTVVEVTDANLAELAVGSDVVFLDFWASWCGPCRQFSPVYDRVAARYPDALFGKVNTDEVPGLSAKFGISSIPTVIGLKDGEVVYQASGAMPERRFSAAVAEVLSH